MAYLSQGGQLHMTNSPQEDFYLCGKPDGTLVDFPNVGGPCDGPSPHWTYREKVRDSRHGVVS